MKPGPPLECFHAGAGTNTSSHSSSRLQCVSLLVNRHPHFAKVFSWSPSAERSKGLRGVGRQDVGFQAAPSPYLCKLKQNIARSMPWKALWEEVQWGWNFSLGLCPKMKWKGLCTEACTFSERNPGWRQMSCWKRHQGGFAPCRLSPAHTWHPNLVWPRSGSISSLALFLANQAG